VAVIQHTRNSVLNSNYFMVLQVQVDYGVIWCICRAKDPRTFRISLLSFELIGFNGVTV
jgi:hypothetical protein